MKEQRQIRLYFVKFTNPIIYFALVYLDDIFISLLPLFLGYLSPPIHPVPELMFFSYSCEVKFSAIKKPKLICLIFL